MTTFTLNTANTKFGRNAEEGYFGCAYINKEEIEIF